MSRSSQRILSLATTVEARRKDQSVRQKYRASCFRSFMTTGLLFHIPCSGIEYSYLFVSASRHKLTAVVVPGDGVNHIRMAVDRNQHGATTNIPDRYYVIPTYAKNLSEPLFSCFISYIPHVRSTFCADGCQATIPTRLWWNPSSTTASLSVSVRISPWSGICHTYKNIIRPPLHILCGIQPLNLRCYDHRRSITLAKQSSLPLAITLSLWGHQAMSSTGPLWPPTSGWSGATRPVWNTKTSCSNSYFAYCFTV